VELIKPTVGDIVVKVGDQSVTLDLNQFRCLMNAVAGFGNVDITKVKRVVYGDVSVEVE